MTGIFTVSIDTELMWGVLHWGKEEHQENIMQERKIIDDLLVLFKKYKISATWAIVGHLFLDSCQAIKEKKHPGMSRPAYPWLTADWYEEDPSSNIKKAPLFYGKDIVQKVARASPKQEIGSHGFSHALFGEKGFNENVAEAEISKCVEIAKKFKIKLHSMVFPQNSIGYLNILKKHGFTCYRGEDPLYYKDWPKLMQKIAHPADLFLATTPPVVEAKKTKEGLINIPGSMLYLSSDGIRRNIPVQARVDKAKKGIDAAIAQGKIFHLWFHPFNLVSNREEMFAGLEEIFKYANEKIKAGSLEILTMGEIAERANKND